MKKPTMWRARLCNSELQNETQTPPSKPSKDGDEGYGRVESSTRSIAAFFFLQMNAALSSLNNFR
jgi:hypothetical protein